MAKRYLTLGEAAQELRVSVKTIRREVARFRLRPVLRINARIILIPVETLQAYERERTG